MQEATEARSNERMQERPLAGRGRRLLATATDAFLVPALTLVLVMLTNVVEDAEDYRTNAWMLHVLGLAIASYLILNGYGLARHGQTLGKRLFGVAIVDQSGDRVPPLWKLIGVRAWFFPLMFLIVIPITLPLVMLDLLLIFRSDRRCLHDFVAGTRVVEFSRRGDGTSP